MYTHTHTLSAHTHTHKHTHTHAHTHARTHTNTHKHTLSTHTQHTHTAHTAHPQHMHSTHAQHIHSTCTAYTQHTHSTHTQHTANTHTKHIHRPTVCTHLHAAQVLCGLQAPHQLRRLPSCYFGQPGRDGGASGGEGRTAANAKAREPGGKEGLYTGAFGCAMRVCLGCEIVEEGGRVFVTRCGCELIRRTKLTVSTKCA